MVGASAGGRTGRDYITVKVRANGSRAWARRYAGPSDFDEARSVAVDPRGNVYVTGQSRVPASKPGVSGPPRIVTISYSSTGVRRWIILDRGKWASATAIMYCGQGARGVVLAGGRYSGSPAAEHTFFTKYTLGGRVIWSRTPSGGTRWNEWPEDAALDATGAPVAAGIRQPPGMQAWLTGVSATGSRPWHSSFASAFDNPDWAEFVSVAVAADGRVLAAGDTASGEMAEMGDLPTTFLVRFSPSWPVTAPLDLRRQRQRDHPGHLHGGRHRRQRHVRRRTAGQHDRRLGRRAAQVLGATNDRVRRRRAAGRAMKGGTGREAGRASRPVVVFSARSPRA